MGTLIPEPLVKKQLLPQNDSRFSERTAVKNGFGSSTVLYEYISVYLGFQ
jgi:hypothetical protein